MDWEAEVKAAEDLLHSTVVPSSEQIITSIKRVNPTRLCLPVPDKERGYEIKNRLQNLLLENYGEVFHLVPLPCSPQVVLIKHLYLPSIDACHVKLDALSLHALDTIPESSAPAEEKCDSPKGKRGNLVAPQAVSARKSLSHARQLLDAYDYAEAEQELTAIRVTKGEDLAPLIGGIRMLLQEMGAYHSALQTIHAQPARVMQEKSIRELLALAYHGNGSWAEAGAVLDSLNPCDLGKESLCAYAGLAFMDGNISFALKLVRLAEEKEGFVTGLDDLKKQIEQALCVKAEPVLEKAAAALALGEWEQARALAQEALQSSRNHPRARRILAVTECLALHAEASRLWRAVEQQGEGKERIRLLARLLEIDRCDRGRIEELMQAERASVKRETIRGHLCALRLAHEKQKWSDCFEEIAWLSRQEGASQAYHEGISLSSQFEVLRNNARLERLPHETAKAAWLSFVEATTLLRAGRHKEALPMLRKTRPFFRGCPQFADEYDKALSEERVAGTAEARRLLEEARAEGRSFAEVAELNAAMRKILPLLSPKDRAAFSDRMDERLEELRPRKSRETLLEEYREAALMGNSSRASSLARQLADPVTVEAVDAEIEALLKIEVEPMQLSISQTLEIDLNRGNPLLGHRLSTGRHICLELIEEGFVLIDLMELTAWRLKSPLLRGLRLIDGISEKNQFLFAAEEEGDQRLFRAVLHGAESRFTSVFHLPAHLFPGEKLAVLAMLMSGDKETEYYCILEDPGGVKGVRMAKISVGSTRKHCQTHFLTGKVTGVTRISSAPDSFAVSTDSQMMICNKNLVPSTQIPAGGKIVAVDQCNKSIYGYFEILLFMMHFDLSSKKQQFYNAASVALFGQRSPLGISPDTDTMLFSFKAGRGTFYNPETNRLSSQVSLSSVICTDIPSTYYYMEYDQASSSITLRDITTDLGELLQWKELFIAGQPREEFEGPLTRLLEGADLVLESFGDDHQKLLA